MSELLENGAPHNEEETEELSDGVNPSPPPSDTFERVEELLDKVESYNSVIPDAVTRNILESAGISDCSTDVRKLPSEGIRDNFTKYLKRTYGILANMISIP